MQKAKRPLRESIRFVFFWLAAAVCELPFIEGFVLGKFFVLEKNLGLIFTLHIFSVVLIFFSLSKKGLQSVKNKSWCYTFAFFSFFLPVLGWFLTGLLFFNSGRITSEKQFVLPEPMQEKFLFETLEYTPPENISREDRMSKELDIVPLTDILAGPDLNLKRGAIEKLVMLATPESINTLLAYRSDSSPEMRFYVTTALARVKKKFDEVLDAAKKEMQKNIYNNEIRLKLAKIYTNYANSHLLDEATAALYHREAVYHLKEVLISGTPLTEALWDLIKIYESDQKWEDLMASLHLFEQKEKIDSNELAKAKVFFYYYEKQYQQMLKTLSQISIDNKCKDGWLVLKNWWGIYT